MFFLKIYKLAAQFKSMFGIIETMVYHLSTPWVLLGPWFHMWDCEYYLDYGYPKSTAIAAIPPMASSQQERVYGH